MRIRTSWVAVGAVAVLGVGATTTAATALNDRAEIGTTTGTIDLPAPVGEPVDTSPESADSPNASAVDSAGSASDSPDDPGYVAPAAPAAPGARSGSATSASQVSRTRGRRPRPSAPSTRIERPR